MRGMAASVGDRILAEERLIGRARIHALCVAGYFDRQSCGAPAADRPPDPHRAGDKDGLRQDRPCIWIPPIRSRIDMPATGIKSPLGINIAGDDLATIERVADVQSIVSAAIGGENIGETIEGRARFPINVRYPRELRDSIEALRRLPIVTERNAQIHLGAIASLVVTDGPPMLRSENARLASWIYVDIRGRDLAAVVADAKAMVARNVDLGPGVSVSWSGQFEFLERAQRRLAIVVPAIIVIIFVLLYLVFRRVEEAVLILAGLAPIMGSGGTGDEVMQRIAAPMIGSMITAPLLSMIVLPVVDRLLRRPSAMAGRVSAAWTRRVAIGSAEREPDLVIVDRLDIDSIRIQSPDIRAMASSRAHLFTLRRARHEDDARSAHLTDR